jgi:hemoglobin-like flavoprotein
MTPQHKRLVRTSFEEISEAAEPIALLFYGRLFELDPALRPLFVQDIRVQSRKLMAMLAVAVDSLDDLDQLAPALRALGQRHAGYGVQPEHYATLKAALLWAFGQALRGGLNPDTKDAWRAVIDAISTYMMDGASELTPP